MTNPMPTLARTAALTLLMGTVAAVPAAAEDRALLIVNEEYGRISDLDFDSDVDDMREAIEAAGFDVTEASDADLGDMLDALEDFAGDVRDEDDARLVVLLGRYVRVGSSFWLLGSEVNDRTPDLSDLATGALSLDLVAATLVRGEGRRALMLGGPAGEADDGSLIEEGLHPENPPLDLRVPMAAGRADDVIDAVTEVLMRPGGRLDEAELERRDLGGRRLGDDGIGVRDEGDGPARLVITVDDAERNYWEVVERFDNQTGYEAYLRRFPQGPYADTARARLAAITSDPGSEARDAEASLNLTREDRRAVQSHLVLLGFDTRGVDGIFGAGSRDAITGWQDRNGYEETGYLTGEQIRVLDAQGARRQAELDAERERRRASAERLDRDFWDSTGAGSSPDGLRRYLDRFPDGIYASSAEARLDALAEESRAQASARDRQAWNEAEERGRPGAYRRYLRDNPNGAYRDAAARRLRELTGAGDEDGEARRLAAETERQLGLDTEGRRLVEAGLETFGLEPGTVDGEFDRSTRRALRRYQEERGLPVTGFMSQDIVVRMLAERVLR